MFTGIIETLGILKQIEKREENFILTVESTLSNSLKIDQSLSHNGICLTIIGVEGHTHQVVAIGETVEKTTVDHWKVGDNINLERAILVSGRLDGHIVQGHIDQTAKCTKREDHNGSIHFTFTYDITQNDHMTVPKGSIAIDGISLTVVNANAGLLSVAIIPYTIAHTNLKDLKVGGIVNLEFDILGKYAVQHLKHYNKSK